MPQLASPYRNERLRAVEQLSGDVTPESLAALLAHEETEVRGAAAQVAQRRPTLVTPRALRDRLLVEPDPLVREHLLDALLATDAGADLLEAPAGPWQRRAFERFVLARLEETLEGLMSDDRVPGFYDGQFQQVWGIAPGMAERLIEIAKLPDCHFVIRALCVMALHETRRPTLEEDLGPLLMDVQREFAIAQDEFFDPRPNHPLVIEQRRLADLSRYARFALAKAGLTRAIRDMIRRMDQELTIHSSILESRGSEEDGVPRTLEDLNRMWLRNLLFESGYYFQQFDDYAGAEQRYQLLVTRYPESQACQNAYYNLACIEAIRGNTARSLAYLEQAVLQGFTDFEWLLEDGDLTSVRSSPEFTRIVELARTGRTDREGATWLAKLTPFLPPGQSLFSLPRAQRAAVLREAAGALNEAEARALVEAAPAEQKEECRALLEGSPPPP